MRRINKGPEPVSLTQLKLDQPLFTYQDMDGAYSVIRSDIRQSCIAEQFSLCAYCCDRVDNISSHNEHIIPQSDPMGASLTLEYTNIVASCNSNNHCGHFKKNNAIPLTPLMGNCEGDIIYQLNGKMTHRNPDAQRTISILNLRNSALSEKRKNIIDLIIFEYVDDLGEMVLEDVDFLELMIDELRTPDAAGMLEAFSPVIINVLRQLIT
ncbi:MULTISPECIES: retron system putative HNH endonuclease [Sphingobacterium]|uniref:retron system putative HNH endonuclease n=1 Tax=Sphingobacterium TaxID=28453 RepID=UPI0013DAEA1B|nr:MULTISPECIES: retron system putative HNH endonuclease [unclassified Sphingobacterium]